MLEKRSIINFLFVLSFPLYGLGNFISASKSPSIGFIFSASAHIIIILFYLIDIIYKKEFQLRINGLYFLVLLFIASDIISLTRALINHLPEENSLMLITKSVLLLAPFNAFVIVMLYNSEDEDRLAKLTFLSLSLLLLLNLIGFFGLGLSNQAHSIEGRVNFPFLDGLYSGACLLAIINLMLMYSMSKCQNDPFRFSCLLTYFIFNLILLFLINSRLTILVFLFVALLYWFKLITRTKTLFVGSLFTVPILLNSGLILYQILSLPVFVSILRRVDIKDITTFNGRSFIWTNAMNWLTTDQRGIVFGNGYKGHYFLDLISDVAKLWNPDSNAYYHMHLHSTSFEILICQGLIGFVLFMILFYNICIYYEKRYQSKDEHGTFLAVAIFLLFIMQIDVYVYLESSGFLLFALLIANAAIIHKPKLNNKTEGVNLIAMNGQ